MQIEEYTAEINGKEAVFHETGNGVYLDLTNCC